MNYRLLIFPFLIIFFISCHYTGDIEVIEPRIERQSLEAGPIADITQADLLSNQMGWVAYLSVKTILSSEQAKDQFITAVNQSTATGYIGVYFSVDELLGAGTENSEFFLAFKDHYEYYNANGADADGCAIRTIGGAPQPLTLPGGVPPGTTFDSFAAFITEITSTRCYEIYLPVGINAEIKSAVSTAHPMNRSGENLRYDHLGYTNCVKESNISNENVGCLDNVIVVRPRRGENSCSYSDYGLDFEQFLNKILLCTY